MVFVLLPVLQRLLGRRLGVRRGDTVRCPEWVVVRDETVGMLRRDATRTRRVADSKELH